MSGQTTEELQLIVRAVDQAVATLKAIQNETHGIGTAAESTDKQVATLGSRLEGLANQIKRGFGIAIGQDLFGIVQNGLQKLVDFIPEAISQGSAWAQQVHQVQVETGMTAEQTSLLLAVMNRADVPLDNVNRLFAMLGKNLSANTALYKELGVATVDANGNQLDTYTIVENLRRRFSEYGGSLAETSAAQKLLGRTGYEMLQFLQLNDTQFRLFADAAAAAGQVLSEDVVAGAERFKRELGDVGGTLQGLQTSIFASLEPTLEVFIDGFSRFLKEHMRDILQFVVNAANFVMGVIGGLLGIDFNTITLSKAIEDAATSSGNLTGNQKRLQDAISGAKKGEDALTASIKAQIAAIDEQIKAIDAREAKRHAAADRAKLVAAIDTAQATLTDITGNAPNVAGLSAAEAVLAEQKHDQDILDARKALSDATAALASFDMDQTDATEKAKLDATKTSLQQQLQAHQATVSAQQASVQALAGTVTSSYKGITASAASAFATMNTSALEWRTKGVAFAGDVKRAIGGVLDMLLGSQVGSVMDGPKGQETLTEVRSGGLVGALKGLGGLMSFIGRVITGTVDGIHYMFVKVSGWVSTFVGYVHKTFGAVAQLLGLTPAPAPTFGYGGGFAMGGYVPEGMFGKVGEVAAETIYAHAGGGVTVYPSSTAGGSGSSSGDDHGHDIYLDGYLIARAVDERNARQHRTTTLRPVGAS